MLDMVISDRAKRLILEHEGLSHADWPGGASGVTIGRGYDLGYHTLAELTADWGSRLPGSTLKTLRTCVGVQGEAAARLIEQINRAAGVPKNRKSIVGIRIPVQVADGVFVDVDLPRWINRARKALACYDKLPDDAQGALVSLVFNRGDAMGKLNTPSWDSRSEMREIRDVLKRWCETDASSVGAPIVLDIIAGEIRSMERLWVGKGLDGLIKRRHAEARLVDAAAAACRAQIAAAPRPIDAKCVGTR